MGAKRDTYFSKKVTLLNVIATFMIVVMHSETPLRFGQELSWSTYPFIWVCFLLTNVAVPLFFFLSAMLFFRDCDWKDIPKKLYRRIFSLLIPFLIWNIFFTAVYFVLWNFPQLSSKMSNAGELNTVKAFVMAVIDTKFTPLWFVKYLIIYNLFAPLILLLVKNKYVGMLSVTLLFAASIYMGWDYFALPHWLPVYISGALVGRFVYSSGKNEHEALTVRLGPGARSCTFVGVAAICVGMVVLIALYPWAKTPFDLLMPLALWLLVDLSLPKVVSSMEVKPWMSCMFLIYATHYMIINIIEGTVRAVCPHTPLVVNLTFVVTPVLTILLIIGMWAVLRRFKFYKYLTGGR